MSEDLDDSVGQNRPMKKERDDYDISQYQGEWEDETDEEE